MTSTPSRPTEGHTEGPWSFDGNCAGYIDQGGAHIARAYRRADAALIALAPTLQAQRDRLVAALKGVIRVADRNTVEFDEARSALRDAGEG